MMYFLFSSYLRGCFCLQIDVLSQSATRVPATYDCCPGSIYPRLDMNFKFRYAERMEGMEIIPNPDAEL